MENTPTVRATVAGRKIGRCFSRGVLLAAMAICWSCSERHQFAGRVLRIAFDDAPPYSVIPPDGTPRGFAVELIQEAARRQRINLKWIAIRDKKPEIEKMLNNHTVDLWPVVGIAKARLAEIYVARPWLENNFFLVSRKAAPVASPAEAKGKRVIHRSGILGPKWRKGS